MRQLRRHLAALGFDVVRQDLEVKRRIGVVPDGLSLFERLTGMEHLRFVGEIQGLSPAVARTRAGELLEAMDLAPSATKPVSGYSHGMRKKLSFLAAVAGSLARGVGYAVLTFFLAIYLAGYGWNEQRVGIALTVGGIAGILTQTPAGALVDRLRSKRTLIAAGIVALAVGALLIALVPTFWPVMSAQV